jgi:acyl dehydratase
VFVRDSGHDEIFFNTGWTAAMLTRIVTDWVGDRGWLSHLDMRMSGMNSPGDTVVVRARVRDRRDEPKGELVDFDVWIENDHHGVTTTGHATVRMFRS